MRTRAAALLVTLGVLAVSCGPADTESSSSAPEETSSDVTTASAATTTSESASGTDVGLYLVEMSNQAADVERQLGDFECSYNEEFFPGSCGVEFVEEDEETEPPPEPTEEEQVAYQQGLWVGMFDMRVAHAKVLGAIAPPPGFESAHRE